MENSLTIHDVKRVFNGILKVGILKTKPEGRAFDGFVYFTEGEVTYKFDTHELKVSADNMIFLPKGSVYEMHIDKKSKYICVDFCFDKSNYVRRADAYKNLPSSVQNEFSKLFYNQYRSEPWCKAETFSSLYNIYAQALRSKYKSYSKSSKKTTDAIRYILENYTEPSLSVSSISNYVGISETHLRRLVKSKLNMSPLQYITSLRIEKAKNMLISSNCMISEIASFCGFADQYYFSREFKAAVGISPTDFKKAHSID